ncbi:MAG: class I SAM-dependent DNA methyltransferase [Novosphingobium sp.]|nr:class I SAM-dependent DNA methyltransferase [Novosphingobium sp.]
MKIEDFIGKYWGKPGGAERATYQMFLTELAQLLGAPTPDPGAGGELGNYQFEGPVRSEAVFLSKHNKRIDLYKRDCFILEAKQSQLKPGETLPEDPPEETLEPVRDLFGNVVGHAAASGKRAPRYDRLMADARIQAERYSLALPTGHRPPPFLIVADIGRAFELYFDWTGDGRGYGFFPDQQNYRIALDALASDALVGNSELTARDLLRAIWLDPASVDPRKKAVAVTRDIAERLSRVAERLEKDEAALRKDRADFEIALGIEKTALFLMRVLFCMFAEDVELLPKDSFTRFLDEARSKTDLWWRRGLSDLWATMNQADEHNRFWSYGDAIVRYFNGNLFSSATVYDLPQEFRGELYEAAKRNWRAVEPAIFGTLLEQVLTKGERAKLGAHYTPRPYVQRLVNATIGDVLNPEWDVVRIDVRMLEEADRHDEALVAVRAFHQRLCDLRVLDPACGTGNFLYVAMELLLQLEGEAIQLAAELGETIAPAIHPNQFLGLELNPRAAVIAELVLWIGWLRHRLANHPDAVADPVLPTLTNINFGTHGGYDAVLRHTPTGEPDFANPMAPAWPEADFIVGNPPFIGGKDIRGSLGGDYAEALWQANPRVPKSADFVMQWWDRAAHLLTAPATRLRRFGFVTTNSITQTFSRRVIEGYLAPNSSPLAGEDSAASPRRGVAQLGKGGGLARASAPSPTPASEQVRKPSYPLPQGERAPSATLSLVLAIPDHPWTRATKDAAAVRIAMTVAQAGAGDGRLVRIVGERGLDSDVPVLEECEDRGRINADLTLGTDVTGVAALKANEGLASPGVKLHGAGFIVSPQHAAHLGLGTRAGLEPHIRPYVNGRDLLQRSRGAMVIDLFGLSESEVRQRFPEVYQHLLCTVKPERDANRRESYKRTWWTFGEPRRDMRPALQGLKHYIATVETSKHRIFDFLDAAILPDNMLIALGSDEGFHLGVLSSRIHAEWALRVGGWLGMGNDNRYNKSKVFDPFPFPDATPAQRATIAELAEELDVTRKAALAETPDLTMTEIYNWREKLRGGTPLSPHDEDRARAARAGIVDRLHHQIDAAVAAAYGWPADLSPAEIVARLVALNATRAAEERAGHVRWLRPDYQIPRFAKQAK